MWVVKAFVQSIVDLDIRDSDLDETGAPAFFVNCAKKYHSSMVLLTVAFTDLLFDKDFPYMGFSSE